MNKFIHIILALFIVILTVLVLSLCIIHPLHRVETMCWGILLGVSIGAYAGYCAAAEAFRRGEAAGYDKGWENSKKLDEWRSNK